MKLHYTYSPPVADVVAERETLRELARCSPLPFVAMAYVILNFGAEAPLLSVAALLVMFQLTRIAMRKRRGRSSVVP